MGGKNAKPQDEAAAETKGVPVVLAVSELGGVPGCKAYHTSVVIDGEEFFFDGNGIETTRNLGSHAPMQGEPKLFPMGLTKQWASSIKGRLAQHFQPGSYDLLRKNCNSFSDACLYFLLGKRLDTGYPQVEQLGAKFPQLVQNVSGGEYSPNPKADGFNLEKVCEEVDPNKVWKTPGHAVGGGGEKPLDADALRRAPRAPRGPARRLPGAEVRLERGGAR